MTILQDVQTAPVRFVDITKRFGDLTAVDNLNLLAEQGKITTLLGPSGCGKTTSLRILAGFQLPDRGEVYVGNDRITDLPAYKRPTRTVFQNYALFPHMSVFDNVAFGLQISKVPKSEQKVQVEQALQLVGLEGLGDRQPGQLSGGQQQRVALARALVTKPKVLLLDEPLSNLDARLRLVMREEIRRLQESLKITVLYVTHDQEEALSLSDKVVVMNLGKVLQVGTPSDVYERPASRFVASFLGLSNFLQGTVLENNEDMAVVRVCDHPLEVQVGKQFSVGDRVVITVRPENLLLAPPEAGGIKGTIVSGSYLGALARYHIKVEDQEGEIIADDHAPIGANIHRGGDEVFLQLRPGRGFILPE
jgi:ABC-type Fe3+/spermidine/putrescine transport system ATPase subunit